MGWSAGNPHTFVRMRAYPTDSGEEFAVCVRACKLTLSLAAVFSTTTTQMLPTSPLQSSHCGHRVQGACATPGEHAVARLNKSSMPMCTRPNATHFPHLTNPLGPQSARSVRRRWRTSSCSRATSCAPRMRSSSQRRHSRTPRARARATRSPRTLQGTRTHTAAKGSEGGSPSGPWCRRMPTA